MPEITTNRNNFDVGANVSMRTTKSGGTEMNYIELAKQAGFSDADDKGVWITDGYWDKELKAFAKLVAAHEREECAKICDEFCYGSTKILVEKAIRARGQA